MPGSFPPIFSKGQVTGRFGISEFEPLLNSERPAELLQANCTSTNCEAAKELQKKAFEPHFTPLSDVDKIDDDIAKKSWTFRGLESHAIEVKEHS